MSAAEIERYAAPRTLAEAAELLRDGRATIIAGGTDVMPQTRAGRLKWQPLLVNINGLDELRGIRADAGAVVIGALTTISALRDSALIRERLGLLWQACDAFASDQIRNAATLGGNLCNASPAGDTLVPLLALEAQAVLAGQVGGEVVRRSVPLGDFFTGPGRTCRAAHELLVAVTVPAPPAGFRGAFVKFGERPALDISTVSLGVGAVTTGGRWGHVRIALGAVAPTPIRARGAEATLEGAELGAAGIAAALRAAEEDIRPISDLRASEWYRRELVHNLLRRALGHVSEG